jgi:hypothetical protein
VYHKKDSELDTSAGRAVDGSLSQLTNKGHTVYVGHFYTNIPLAEELAEVNTGLEEKIMEFSKGLPKALTGAKIKKGEDVFHQTDIALGLWWMRDVWIVRSRPTAQMEQTSNKQGNEKVKPLTIDNFNKHQAGVDLCDQRLTHGAQEHMAVKRWRQLALHCIIMAISNACPLCNTIKNKKLSTSKFIQQVCANLVLPADVPGSDTS